MAHLFTNRTLDYDGPEALLVAGKHIVAHIPDIDGTPLCGRKPTPGERMFMADIEYADKVNCAACKEKWAKVPKEPVKPEKKPGSKRPKRPKPQVEADEEDDEEEDED